LTMSDSEHTLANEESEPNTEILTCSICYEPHTDDNLLCRQCGQVWHRECLVKSPTCPVCRAAGGYVKPRPYDELIHMLIGKKVRCEYCKLIIKTKKPRAHLDKCEKYKNFLLEKYLQQRKVIGIAMEQSVPQDPFELNPAEHLKSKFLVGIPDLRSENRNVALVLKLRPSNIPNEYILRIQPTPNKHFPLTLNLLISDSVTTLPQFPTLHGPNEELRTPVKIEPKASVRVWINLL